MNAKRAYFLPAVVVSVGTLMALSFTGLAAISVGRDPNGISGRVIKAFESLRDSSDIGRPTTAAAGTPAAVFIAEEGESLVGVAR